ncbi:MAG: metal-dependent hydrolase, partial [Methanomassiliicoccales archaeon]|nr:metal-dependent hydrolase [Methanomassiliicoccales archaeon]
LNPLRPENIVSNVVYSSSCQNVKSVLCEGRLIMKDREVLTLDEGEVVDAALDAAKELMG